MQKSIEELSSLITMNLVSKIFPILNELEMIWKDKIESWDYDSDKMILTCKLKENPEKFSIKINV